MNAFENAWSYVWNKLFSEKTNLIYDNPINGIDPKNVFSLPTPEEIKLNIPNPCGWGTGMEDSMIDFGLMLDSVIIKHELNNESGMDKYAEKLLDGALKCANVSGSEGFLARSISPFDLKSYYIDSSRDQYTHCVFSLSRYLKSDMCTDTQRIRITDALLNFAKRAERNVTSENDYHLLRADNKPGIVEKMWEVCPHETLRLPMIFMAAYNASGDNLWHEEYLKYRKKAIEQAFKYDSVWHYCITYQMSLSVLFLYENEDEIEYKAIYAKLLDHVASLSGDTLLKAAEIVRSENIDFSEPITPWRDCLMRYLKQPYSGSGYFMPEQPEKYEREFWLLSDAVNAFAIQAIVPWRKLDEKDIDAFKYIIEAVNYDRHMSRAIVPIVNAYLVYEKNI